MTRVYAHLRLMREKLVLRLMLAFLRILSIALGWIEACIDRDSGRRQIRPVSKRRGYFFRHFVLVFICGFTLGDIALNSWSVGSGIVLAFTVLFILRGAPTSRAASTWGR